MQTFPGFEAANGFLAGGVIAIGNFDGVHRGHQALLRRAILRAQERHARAGVLTFEPHPSKVLAPHLAPPLILHTDEKLHELERAGLDATIVQPFTDAFSQLSPEAFVHEVLQGGIGVSGVVVGQDFSFGKKGAGKVDLLTRLLASTDATVDVVEPVREQGLICSSTKIREFVLAGRVDAAGLLLGRPYWIAGEVIAGDGRGRKMGFPTANIRCRRELLPKVGVYATIVQLSDGREIHSVTNVGLRPTFNGEGVRIEVHLLDFAEDLYGQALQVQFRERLRDERRFVSATELQTQIRADIDASRALLARLQPRGNT